MAMKFVVLGVMLTLLAFSSPVFAEQNTQSSFSGMWSVISNSLSKNKENLTKDDPNFLDDLDTYIKLFLDAAHVSANIKNATDCVDATRDLAKSFQSSINNMISKGFTKDSYLQLTSSFGVAQPAIKVCFNSSYDGYKAASKHLSEFSSAQEFFEKGGLNVAYSFFDWYELYYKFDKAITAKNYTEISILSGKLAYDLLDYDASLNATYRWQDEQVPQVMSGDFKASFLQNAFDLVYHFLKGANVLQSDKVEYCQNNATSVKDNIDFAIAEFKKDTEEGLYNGVYAIADVFGIFYNLNVVCISGYDAATAAIVAYMKVWSVPIEIITNIVWGYRKVYKHMIAAISCAFESDLKCTGLNSGQLVYYIFSHNPK